MTNLFAPNNNRCVIDGIYLFAKKPHGELTSQPSAEVINVQLDLFSLL